MRRVVVPVRRQIEETGAEPLGHVFLGTRAAHGVVELLRREACLALRAQIGAERVLGRLSTPLPAVAVLAQLVDSLDDLLPAERERRAVLWPYLAEGLLHPLPVAHRTASTPSAVTSTDCVDPQLQCRDSSSHASPPTRYPTTPPRGSARNCASVY